MTDYVHLEFYTPAPIAVLTKTAGVNTAKLLSRQMIVFAVLVGAFIGFDTAVNATVMTGMDAGFRPSRLLGGVTFSLGLILVVVGGRSVHGQCTDFDGGSGQTHFRHKANSEMGDL